MSRALKLVNWILGGLLLLLVMYGIETSHAEGKPHNVDVRQSNDMNNQTAGDMLIDGNKSFAIGMGSFDVDINQCLASKATNIVVVGWQTLKENPTCIADGLDARGNHVAAARVRCSSVKTIYNTFPDFEKCVAAVTMVPIIPPRLPNDDDDHGHDYTALQQQLAALVEDKARSDRVTSRYAAQQRQRQEEDRDYAQQLIEEIRQIEEPPK